MLGPTEANLPQPFPPAQVQTSSKQHINPFISFTSCEWPMKSMLTSVCSFPSIYIKPRILCAEDEWILELFSLKT